MQRIVDDRLDMAAVEHWIGTEKGEHRSPDLIVPVALGEDRLGQSAVAAERMNLTSPDRLLDAVLVRRPQKMMRYPLKSRPGA